MPSMQLRRDDVIVGVDTHKDNHVAVAIDGLGGRLGDIVVPTTIAGFEELLAFCLAFVGSAGRLIGFGVEGTGSYGVGLARYLRNHGHDVHEIARPARAAERRLAGKNDTIDAEHAARQLLAGHGLSTPKTADGAVETIRLVKIAYDGAVQARTTAMITLKATLATGSEALRAELETLTDHKLILACAALEGPTPLPPVRRGAPAVVVPGDPDVAMRHVLSSMAKRWLALHEEAKAHAASLKALTAAAAPQLVEAVGVGYDTAAQMLITAGDNANRIKSEAAFAKMCGAVPDPGWIRQDQQPAPSVPRREPAGQRRAVSRGHRAHALASADDRLRGPSHRRGHVEAGDHPVPEAVPRSRALPPAAGPGRHRQAR